MTNPPTSYTTSWDTTEASRHSSAKAAARARTSFHESRMELYR